MLADLLNKQFNHERLSSKQQAIDRSSKQASKRASDRPDWKSELLTK